MTELIYDTMDEDVAEYLNVSRCYEVIGMTKDCDGIRELQEKVARYYGKRPVQFTLFFKPPKD